LILEVKLLCRDKNVNVCVRFAKWKCSLAHSWCRTKWKQVVSISPLSLLPRRKRFLVSLVTGWVGLRTCWMPWSRERFCSLIGNWTSIPQSFICYCSHYIDPAIPALLFF